MTNLKITVALVLFYVAAQASTSFFTIHDLVENENTKAEIVISQIN